MGPILHFSWRPARQAFSKQVNQPNHMMYVLGLSPWCGYHPQQPLKENISESFSKQVNQPDHMMYVLGLSPWYGYHPQQPLKENVSESFSEEVNHPNAFMYMCFAFHRDCHYHTGSIREEKCK